MSEELEKVDAWSQLEKEAKSEYIAFTEYCKLGPRRTIRMVSAHLGISYDTVRGYSRKNNWVARSDAYDKACNDLTPQEISSPTETLAYQYMVGSAMLELGIKAIEMKRPGDIKVSDAIKMIDRGSDLQRKALGIDNPSVQINLNNNNVDALNEILKKIEDSEYEGDVIEDV